MNPPDRASDPKRVWNGVGTGNFQPLAESMYRNGYDDPEQFKVTQYWPERASDTSHAMIDHKTTGFRDITMKDIMVKGARDYGNVYLRTWGNRNAFN